MLPVVRTCHTSKMDGTNATLSPEEPDACNSEPDPDYIVDEEDKCVPDLSPSPVLTVDQLSAAVAEAYDMHVHMSLTSEVVTESRSNTEPRVIRPMSLPNPCTEFKELEAVNKELLMNCKTGKDVLQKPELIKVLRERKEKERRKEWDLQHPRERTSLEIKFEERANRIKEEEDGKLGVLTRKTETPELIRVHRKITLKPSSSVE